MNKIFVLLIILILVGAVFVFNQSQKNEITPTPSPSSVTISEQPEDLLRKCGDIFRDDFGVNYSHYTQITGPEWNSDCSYAAIGMWQSGTSYLGDDPEEVKKFQEFAKQEQITRQKIQGIYLFNPQSKTSEKIYTPKSDTESPEFLRWEGNEEIIFRASQKTFKLNIATKEVVELPNPS